MGRWEPDAAGRLQRAAYELFAERGYDQTTVADIAARVGLTQRTFFRHFADKREVLFAGSDQLGALLLDSLEQAPPGDPPLAQVAAALDGLAGFFVDRDGAARRQAVISSHPELRERELIKLATLSQVLAERLRERGVAEPGASLATDSGLAAFRVAFASWLDSSRSFGEEMTAALTALRALLR